MKTIFVVGKTLTIQHKDEEYDDVLVVEDSPDNSNKSIFQSVNVDGTMNTGKFDNEIERFGVRLRDSILKLWDEDKELITIHFDAHRAYLTAILNMIPIMKESFGIIVNCNLEFDEEEGDE